MCEDLLTNMKTVMTAIAKCRDIFLQRYSSKLKLITKSVLSMTQKANPTYVLAMPHMPQCCHMKLVTFDVDNYHSLFFIFAVLLKACNMVLVTIND